MGPGTLNNCQETMNCVGVTAKRMPTQLNSPPAHSTHRGRRPGRRVRAGEGGLPGAGGRRLGLHTQSSGSSRKTPRGEGAILEKGFHPGFRQARPAKILEELNIPSPPHQPLNWESKRQDLGFHSAI